jgi:hypothetical protein
LRARKSSTCTLPWRASFAPDDSGLIVEYGTYDLRTLLTYTRL